MNERRKVILGILGVALLLVGGRHGLNLAGMGDVPFAEGYIGGLFSLVAGAVGGQVLLMAFRK